MDLSALGRQFGLDEQQTRSAFEALAPVVAAGMRRNAVQSSGGGLGDLLGSLGGGNPAAYADDYTAFERPGAVDDGNAVLGQIFGSKDVSRGVAQQLSGSTGISDSILKKLLPLVAAVLTAGRDTLTRMIGAELPARSIALTTAVAVMMAGLTTAPLGEWVALDVALLGGLFVCALLLAVAYVLLVSAVRTGEVSFIAPFRYVSILLALVFGITVFGDTPSFSACLGGAVIVGSGLLIFHRERARSR